ncbi:uncharacterized protein PHACADRAFT_257398 [Phanerochaete carnosa HHB-10118-sp]|uniref:Uncharacterized protein n=1 Tax=Phanerochaete carnosa (strain HHB-10118-sp) TaxID=650164 RepID=K5VR24_PHACS|nr:uncharacterized protein PHACADRAFT_257398 [Phanerochaete carnosa HHB-10118-sp]EKM53908.1 hypothetical protein PHACADRAFT_257398 [Phanerochaete carnosa HHB-10118-sp]
MMMAQSSVHREATPGEDRAPSPFRTGSLRFPSRFSTKLCLGTLAAYAPTVIPLLWAIFPIRPLEQDLSTADPGAGVTTA